MAKSTTKVEFILATAAVNQTLWLTKLFSDLHRDQKVNIEVHVDNQASIVILHNPVFNEKTKHFNVKFFLLRDVQKRGEVILVYFKSEDQLADVFMKSLPVNKFEFLRQ